MAKIRFVSVAATFAILGMAATSASAADREVRVEHGDLDLAKPADKAEFKSRIARAAHNVCAFPRATSARDRFDQLQCEARAKTSAMRKAEQKIARSGAAVKVAID